MAKQILVVEDESIVAKDIRIKLENLGYTVSAIVSSGEEAIQKAEDNPNLVLMDIVLKGDMDGIEAAEIIRTRFDIPVVYVTAHAEKNILQRAKITEPYGYILKPFKDRELHAAIEMALYKHKMEKKLKAQKEVEEALRESELRYHALFESMLVGVSITNFDGKVLVCNDAILQMAGYSREDLEHVNAEDVYNPEERAVLLNKVQKNGLVRDYEVELKRKDGTPFFVRVNVALGTLEGEKVLLTMVEEITEQKKVKEMLKLELDVNNALSELYEPLISPSSSIEDITNTVLDQAKHLTGSVHGYVSSIDPDTGDNVGHTLTEMLKDQCKVSPKNRRIAFPRGEDGLYPELWGHSLNTRQAFFTNSPEVHPAFRGVPRGHVPVQTFLSVPVLLGEELVGQIALANKRGRYSERDLDAVRRLAEIYALAIQRMQAEELLRESEEKYRELVENINDTIYAVDDKGIVIYVSPVVESFIGYSPSEVIGHHFREFFYQEDLPLLEENFHKILSGNIAANEYRILTKSGEMRWIYTSSRPVFMGNRVIGVRGVLSDITERKKAEEQIRELSSVAEQSSDGIAIGNLELTLTYVNRAFAKMHGYSPEEMVGMHVENLHSEEQIDEYKRKIKKMKKEGSWMGEMGHVRKDGTAFPTYVSFTLLKDGKGEPTGILEVARDITERKKAEEQIKASLEEKEVLLQEIHHRVKNNMQVISSLLSLQSEHIKDSQYAEIFKESQNRIQSMALVHEKLYQSENLAEINVNEYITSLVHGLFRSYEVAADRVAVTIEVEDISLGINAAVPCGLIINELVSNSLKHAFPDRRKGEITVKLRSINKTIELTVADNGVGLAEEIDFKKTESLGLDLVTTLAEYQLDGEITLDRSGGTAFTITFKEEKQ